MGDVAIGGRGAAGRVPDVCAAATTPDPTAPRRRPTMQISCIRYHTTRGPNAFTIYGHAKFWKHCAIFAGIILRCLVTKAFSKLTRWIRIQRSDYF